jgi:ribosome-associated protein
MEIEIIHKELIFRASRSSGSGGQHVNKVSTRIELLFDVGKSEGLSDTEKALIQTHLANRINSDGILSLAADGSRSQLLNKRAVVKRFNQLIMSALQPRKTRPTAGAYQADRQKRLTAKKRNADRKAARRKLDMRDTN